MSNSAMTKQGDDAFALLDESAIMAAKLRHDPYDFAFAESAINARFQDEVADAPRIPDRGSYGLPNLRYGPRFGAVIQYLLSPQFRHLVEQKFDTDLSHNPSVILMMGNTTGHSTPLVRLRPVPGHRRAPPDRDPLCPHELA